MARRAATGPRAWAKVGNWNDRGHGFELYHDKVFHEHVDAKCRLDAQAVINNRDGHLTFDTQSAFSELVRETSFICALQ